MAMSIWKLQLEDCEPDDVTERYRGELYRKVGDVPEACSGETMFNLLAAHRGEFLMLRNSDGRTLAMDIEKEIRP